MSIMINSDALESSALFALTDVEKTLDSALDYTKTLYSWKIRFYKIGKYLNDAYESHNQAVQAVLTLEADHPEMALECTSLLSQAKIILDLNKERLQSYTYQKRIPQALLNMKDLFSKEVGTAYVEPEIVEVSVLDKL